jgi:hypothetical protein
MALDPIPHLDVVTCHPSPLVFSHQLSFTFGVSQSLITIDMPLICFTFGVFTLTAFTFGVYCEMFDTKIASHDVST